MRLRDLLEGLEYELLKGQMDTEITGIAYDSRRVSDGDLFVCISGFRSDGHAFAEQAIKNGAVAVLAARKLDITQQAALLITPDTRQAMARLASNFYQQPSRALKVIGVTGTNGKTTTTHLIQAILEEAGKTTGILGTLYARMGDYSKELGHTTPEALEIEDFISYCVKQNAEYVVMEVSSHALDLHRVDLISFNTAVFTNLTQDHLDYHHNMENYRNTKAKLFAMIAEDKNNFCVLNTDDPYGEYFKNLAASRYYTYGLNNDADVRAADLNIDLRGSQFTIHHQTQSVNINIKLVGLFSVYNVLAAVACALGEGVSLATIKSALEKVEGVPGRFEKVDCGQDFTVIVDYAHTPDGLENILLTAKQIAKHRLISVFGCGGDRDRGKRPLMGEIAARYSDFCIVTSDNPRSEEPEDIIADIIPGLDRVEGSRYAIITDRREAIHHAIHLAKAGDLLIIAGKGHETYQLVKDQVLEFDDRKIAAEYLQRKE
ncbi:MAG: UDP-N-acetylmuramoyl-L-alanyl-D-glutamate--2,6-diaminopimelate ligase [Syntrophomonadaceae bacterium]|nr:UDP-N-acetylmuramoyl-L-alanyl-D-glutamate--2,6-diaminopimelate ligase [Syntrophomonadaceae bacterium]